MNSTDLGVQAIRHLREVSGNRKTALSVQDLTKYSNNVKDLTGGTDKEIHKSILSIGDDEMSKYFYDKFSNVFDDKSSKERRFPCPEEKAIKNMLQTEVCHISLCTH